MSHYLCISFFIVLDCKVIKCLGFREKIQAFLFVSYHDAI